jgi:LPS export ABC transporter permease LptF/LPS export ABC transporter permease LptG
MRRRLIERYVLAALLPYTALALLILTATLLTQQSSRFAEVLGAARAPLQLAFEITVYLLPNILIFTLPMAVLVGTATGFSRLGSDSELIAMRAAGVGTWRIMAPVLLWGLLLSGLNVSNGFLLAPSSAHSLRDVALRAALHKLESPVEPRSFYAGMEGKVVYVRGGDIEKGEWEKVFIYWQEPGKPTRLVTARTGRIDVSGEQSELVLEDASITTLPQGGAKAVSTGASVTTEHSEKLRLRDDRLNQSRADLIRRIQGRELELDEMNWRQLLRRVSEGEDESARREATIAFNKRLSLCLAPVVFAFLGAGVGQRLRRGGRALGVLLSLGLMLLYYLISIAGEQLSRAQILPPVLGAWLPICLSILTGIWFVKGRERRISFRVRLARAGKNAGALSGRASFEGNAVAGRRRLMILGQMDKGILISLTRFFLLCFLLLVSIFLVFTLFELLRFIALDNTRGVLLARYLVYLLPFVAVAVAPVSTLLSVLLAFALMARRSEVIAWGASGQSVFRLVIPSLFFALCVGGGLWVVQERLMPAANRKQNVLRAMIKSGVASSETQQGRRWVASSDMNRIYSYGVLREGESIEAPLIFEFDQDETHLTRLVLGEAGRWTRTQALGIENAEVVSLQNGVVTHSVVPELETPFGDMQLFKDEPRKPTEMDASGLSAYINSLRARGEDVQTLASVLERKRAEPFAPLVMAFVASPLALAFGRKSAVSALCVAVVIGLIYWGLTSGFQQLGGNGLLPPKVAAWSPPFIFAAVGMYFLSKVRT